MQWKVTGMVITQIIACYVVKDLSWPVLLLAAYCFGGVINHSMTLAIHELAHNLAYGSSRPTANRALAIFGNTIIGVPSAVTFKKYHLDHHRYQGFFLMLHFYLVWLMICERPKPFFLYTRVKILHFIILY